MGMKLYLGLIRYRPNVQWFEIYRLINAKSKEEAEEKLKKWADENKVHNNRVIIITETL